MARYFVGVFLLAGLVGVSVGQYWRPAWNPNTNSYEPVRDPEPLPDLPSEDCYHCQRDRCPIPRDCEAGTVRDKCDCCEVCAKKEFEKCDHPQDHLVRGIGGESHGKCGDNLECRWRDDLDEDDPPESACYCKLKEPICGSDQQTYDNQCQFREAEVRSRGSLVKISDGPCKSAPVMIGEPVSVKDTTGSDVALLCEATGFPIPTIVWTYTRVDGKTIYMPGDDLRISVIMRGGPEKLKVSGWIQIMEVGKEHEGDYTCIAENEMGEATAMGRINVDDGSYHLPRTRGGRYV